MKTLNPPSQAAWQAHIPQQGLALGSSATGK